MSDDDIGDDSENEELTVESFERAAEFFDEQARKTLQVFLALEDICKRNAAMCRIFAEGLRLAEAGQKESSSVNDISTDPSNN